MRRFFTIFLGIGIGLLTAQMLLVALLRVCQRRRVWPALLYTRGGAVLLTLLNIGNAHWQCR